MDNPQPGDIIEEYLEIDGPTLRLMRDKLGRALAARRAAVGRDTTVEPLRDVTDSWRLIEDVWTELEGMAGALDASRAEAETIIKRMLAQNPNGCGRPDCPVCYGGPDANPIIN